MSYRAHTHFLKAIKTIAVVLLMPFSHTSEANAAGGVGCVSKAGDAEISINMGRVPIYAPSFASARLGEKIWVTNPQSGELELGSSQGLIEEDRFSADFTDENVTKIIISLRVDFTAEEEEDGVPGTLTFEDGIPRKVLCQFE